MLKRSGNPDLPVLRSTTKGESGKNTILLFISVIFLSSILFADSAITRGPDIGEIYYIGPTATGEGIYRSTDFGETATCMDSTLNININFLSIAADLTPGVLYGFAMPENLYISYNYGEEGSWVFRSNDISAILSGRLEGYIYNGKASHSDDYGVNFINHANNGYFGSLKAVEIDNQDSVGYALAREYSVNDSLWLLISNDDFENFEVQHSFNWYSVFDYSISRGSEVGELYLMKSAHYGDGSMVRELWFSNDYGENWFFKNHLLSTRIVGGRQAGELYILANYTQLMGEIKHTYIYHSLDYGETFTVYHPFAYGSDPYYANFEAEPITGSAPLTVQFTDLSSGDIQTWEWDFDLDGTVDSYEQNPEYTFQDTGFYSVKLRIYGDIYEDGYIKTDYIHVTDGSGAENHELQVLSFELNNYPNPFNPTTTFSFNETINLNEKSRIEIYNVKGQKVDELTFSNQQSEVSWNAEGFKSGIYFYKLNLQTTPIKKMLLLK